MRIGMFGTFDVENYGDLLFPILAEYELKQRLDNVEIIRYSYNEKNETSWCYNVRSLAEFLGKPANIQTLDIILIGGGHLIRFDEQVANQYQPPLPQIPHPTGYWLAPALAGISAGIPVLWNAPSSSDEFPVWAHGLLAFALEKSAYVSVRDSLSFEALRRTGFMGNCNVVPDTVFSLARHFPCTSLSIRVNEILASIELGRKYLIIQGTSSLESVTKVLLSKADILSDFDILILPIGPILGDDVLQIKSFLPQAKYLPFWPSPIEIAGLIAHSSGVITMSLHLSITALNYGLPVLRPATAAGQKYALLKSSENVYFGGVEDQEGVAAFVSSIYSNDPHLCSLVMEAQSKVGEHWDRIAEVCRKPQTQGLSLADDFAQANLLLVRQRNLGKVMADLEEQVELSKTQVTDRDQEIQSLTSKLASVQNSRLWKLGVTLRRIWNVNFLFDKFTEKKQLKKGLALIRSSDLFEEAWYLSNNMDVANSKMDPVSHYLLFGGLERRDPSPYFNGGWYLDTYEDVKKSGINPLVHYLEHGREEGRLIKPIQQVPISSEFHVASGTIKVDQNVKVNETAVILHLFYEDLFEEIEKYLKNLDGFDLYVSIPQSNRGVMDKIFSSFPNSKIVFTENRGRDIFPFISIFKRIVPLNYKYILKIHSKKTLHREDGDIWRTDIYGKLMGSPEIIKSVLSAFENDKSIGIIGPKGHVLDYQTYWGGNKKKTEELAGRIGIKKDIFSFNFVAGSMFWATSGALQYFSLLPLNYEEFEPEPLGYDGSLVHALERFIGLAAAEEGYSILEVDTQARVSIPQTGAPDNPYPFTAPSNLHVAEGKHGADSQST